MLCRGCEAVERDSERRERRTQPLRVVREGGAAPPPAAPDPQCRRCGQALDTAYIAQRLRHKQSQLAQFGLADQGQPLLRAADREKG